MRLSVRVKKEREEEEEATTTKGLLEFNGTSSSYLKIFAYRAQPGALNLTMRRSADEFSKLNLLYYDFSFL